MRIFSTHRRKLEPHRRYGSISFKNKVKAAGNYKRMFNTHPRSFLSKILGRVGLGSRLAQYAIIGIVLAVLYYIFVSDYFLVSAYEFSGNRQVTAQQLEEGIKKNTSGRLFLIPKNHLFVMSEGRINKIMAKEFPMFKGVAKYNRIWPNRVSLDITERNPGFIMSADGKFYLVDEEGFLVNETDDNKNMVLVNNHANSDVAVGDSLPSKLSGFILSMSRSWRGELKSQVDYINISSKATNDVEFKTKEGWGVYFDINRPVVSQLNGLALIINKQVPIRERLNLAYIDLRLEKWAYICYRNTPCYTQEQKVEITEDAPTTN